MNRKMMKNQKKHVIFVEYSIKISMMNLSIFIIGEIVQCLHAVGNVIRLLKLNQLKNTYWKSAGN